MSTTRDPEESEDVDPYAPLADEEEFEGMEIHLVPEVPPGPNPNTDYDACNARKTERIKEGGSNRTLFRGWCQADAGSGTDHKGEGRCKWHGGASQNGGAPAHNQNAQKHALSVDPHHYAQNLDVADKGFLRDIENSIERRMLKQKGEVDFLDRVMARRVAIELHIVSKASAHVENESGLIQIITGEHGSEEKKAALLDDIRKRDKDIIGMLKNLGVLEDPESKKADALDEWRQFVQGGGSEGGEDTTSSEVIDIQES